MGLFDLFKKKKPAVDKSAQPETITPEDAAPVVEAVPVEEKQAQRTGRMRRALNRTRAFFATAFATDPEGLVDDEFYDELVDAFVLADVGTGLGQELSDAIQDRMKEAGLVKKADVPGVARELISEILSAGDPSPLDPDTLSVIMLVGVNGSGKTTLAAKLAHRLNQAGHRVLLAAADTFRAAATDQLRVWAGRVGVDIVAGQEGADPASVVFDAAQAARSRGTDVLIVDTAGRLQTKKNLMDELGKVTRTVDKACPGANVAHILVLDATVGQNALSQAELFNECCALTGLAITKLDGTAKGGALIAVAKQLRVPVLYVGVGETPDDLVDFKPADFAAGLMPD